MRWQGKIEQTDQMIDAEACGPDWQAEEAVVMVKRDSLNQMIDLRVHLEMNILSDLMAGLDLAGNAGQQLSDYGGRTGDFNPSSNLVFSSASIFASSFYP